MWRCTECAIFNFAVADGRRLMRTHMFSHIEMPPGVIVIPKLEEYKELVTLMKELGWTHT